MPVSLLRLFPVRGTPLGLTAHQRVTDKVGVRAFASAAEPYIAPRCESDLGDVCSAAARINKAVYAAHADVCRGVFRLLSPLHTRVSLFLRYLWR